MGGGDRNIVQGMGGGVLVRVGTRRWGGAMGRKAGLVRQGDTRWKGGRRRGWGGGGVEHLRLCKNLANKLPHRPVIDKGDSRKAQYEVPTELPRMGGVQFINPVRL